MQGVITSQHQSAEYRLLQRQFELYRTSSARMITALRAPLEEWRKLGKKLAKLDLPPGVAEKVVELIDASNMALN